MPQIEYRVKARSRTGRLVESKIKAVSEAEALSRVRQQGMTPIAVESGGTGLNREIRFSKGRVKLKDIAVFSRQFATMLNSGLPILRCLAILAEQSNSVRLRDVLLEVREQVEKGDALSDALSRHSEFPPIMVNMVRAGEVGGFLDETMLQIAEATESEVRLRGKIKAALTYPVAVGVIAILITIGMLIFIVPVFATLFSEFGGELPLPTRILVMASDTVSNPLFFVPTILIVGGLVFWYRKTKNSPKVRRVVDPLKFRIPVFGRLFRTIALARFTRNFATLLHAGVPILTTLDIVGDTSGNVVIADAVSDIKDSVRQGTGIARPLNRHDVFPDMVVQMIAVGEDSGALDQMLDKVADFYDQEAESTTEQLMALLEPVMIVFLGGIVGGMIIAMYLPIFKIFDLIQ
ncbi:MAG: type II secretion system F family protein [Candidatus Nanopelagicales bacterium]|jgi:type IV pilus assembly protein PilC|nr:type II secretion system F family protein [Candidatus Nanopelagicales bacterium]MCF8537095.1 type II secretion system F family protein [Candidatus Nanopelagicales bacterium]MCF8542740.1 type II secretion system F family protein [Candidatus Nanopelagicales bacterium]MCF8556683.1 type II secretion system F family protein [Candidatus Nanopelagicales bacterium]